MRTFSASTLLVPLLVPLALVSAATPSFSASPAQVRKEIQAAYTAVDQAIDRKDVDTAAEYLTDDFQDIQLNGRVQDKEGFRGTSTRSLGLFPENGQSRTVLGKMQILPDGVVVNSTSVLTVHVRSPQDGRTHFVRAVQSSRDFWVHTDEGWKMKRSRDLSARVTVDGRAIRIPGMEGKVTARKATGRKAKKR